MYLEISDLIIEKQIDSNIIKKLEYMLEIQELLNVQNIKEILQEIIYKEEKSSNKNNINI